MWNAKKLVNQRYNCVINFLGASKFSSSRSIKLKFPSSHLICIKSLCTMEENGTAKTIASDTSGKVSYASVLAKGSVQTDDLSNNNPDPDAAEIGNENQSLSMSSSDAASEKNQKSFMVDSLNDAVSEDNQRNYTVDSLSDAISEENQKSFTADSLSDSFEDAESNVYSNDSIVSNGTVTKEDTPSSLVTECSSENHCLESSSSSIDNEESEEGDTDNESSSLEHTLYPSAMKWKFRSNKTIEDLPSTVTVLETRDGSKVYLVGTAHFSPESQEDVSKTIRAVQPDIVVIELCKSRLSILSLDENALLEEAKTLNFQKIKQTIAENGVLQGVLYLLLLSMSAHVTKELGMAPGGEFRRAFTEAKQIPGCIVHLGDRPFHVTLQRALAKLSFWQKIRIGWHMIRKDPISQEEVERCKRRDLLEEMLAEMTGEFPELSQVFVKERDVYLTYSLQNAASPIVAHNIDTPVPSYVVGVVGIGHVPGIQEHWGKITDEDIPPVMSIPEPSKTSTVIRYTVRYSLYGLGLYALYRVLPQPTRLLNMLKQSIGR